MVKKKRIIKKQRKVTREKKVENKSFWLIIGIVFALSITTIFLGSNYFPLTGNAIQPLAYVKAGTSMDMEFNDISSLKSAKVTFGETIKGSKIIFNDDSTIDFDGVVYSKFKGESPDADKISSVSFVLKIKKSELSTKGIAKDEINLYKNGKELETIFSKEDTEYYYYTSISNGLGNFVIGKKVQAVEVKENIIKQPVVQEPSTIEKETTTEPAMEQPAAVAETTPTKPLDEKGFFSKLASFFKNIFN